MVRSHDERQRTGGVPSRSRRHVQEAARAREARGCPTQDMVGHRKPQVLAGWFRGWGFGARWRSREPSQSLWDILLQEVLSSSVTRFISTNSAFTCGSRQYAKGHFWQSHTINHHLGIEPTVLKGVGIVLFAISGSFSPGASKSMLQKSSLSFERP